MTILLNNLNVVYFQMQHVPVWLPGQNTPDGSGSTWPTPITVTGTSGVAQEASLA